MFTTIVANGFIVILPRPPPIINIKTRVRLDRLRGPDGHHTQQLGGRRDVLVAILDYTAFASDDE